MNDYKLTVFITTYNRANYLKLVIDSVLNQTYQNFKIIVLDNCSTDSTSDIVKEYVYTGKVIYHKHEENIGGPANINYAFINCKTEYFCVFHDDDILHSNLLEKEIAYMDMNPKCCAVSCLANIIDENGKITTKTGINENNRSFKEQEFFKEYLFNQRNLVFPSTMYRNSIIQEKKISINYAAGPCCDIVLYMDIERCGGVIVEINEVLFDYRVYSSQDSSSNFETMLLNLIKYLKTNSYYSKLMIDNLQGRKKYFRWYGKKLLIRCASMAKTADEELEYLSKMQELLEIKNNAYKMFLIFLKLERVMPTVFNYIYKKIKDKNK